MLAALALGGAAFAGSCCVAGANGDPLWLIGEEVAAVGVALSGASFYGARSLGGEVRLDGLSGLDLRLGLRGARRLGDHVQLGGELPGLLRLSGEPAVVGPGDARAWAIVEPWSPDDRVAPALRLGLDAPLSAAAGEAATGLGYGLLRAGLSVGYAGDTLGLRAAATGLIPYAAEAQNAPGLGVELSLGGVVRLGPTLVTTASLGGLVARPGAVDGVVVGAGRADWSAAVGLGWSIDPLTRLDLGLSASVPLQGVGHNAPLTAAGGASFTRRWIR
ncbi:MAG: hypothetical protein RIT28_678 [Pseudomonadota bacterium]|jgi:hypothetical protein